MIGSQGEGFYQIFSSNILQTINNIVCANGDILYCSHINSSFIDMVVSGTTVTNITDNLYTDLGAGIIKGLACSSDGSILYAIDSTKLYKYNRTAAPGARWSIINISVSPSVSSLSEIKCDPTGVYIMLTDAARNFVYFSDNSGTTWQTDTAPNGYYPASIACPSSYNQLISYTNGATVSASTGIYQRIQYLVNQASPDLTRVNSEIITFNKIVTDSVGVKILALDSANPENIYISRDSGVTFTILYTLPSTSGFNLIAANGNFSLIVATTVGGPLTNDGKLYVSKDIGNTFIQVTEYNVYIYYPPFSGADPVNGSTTLPNNSEFYAISVESSGNYTAVSCNNESLLISYDGSSWWGSAVGYSGGTYPRFNSLSVADGSKLYCAGSDGKVYTFIGSIYYIDIGGFNRNPPATVTTVSTGELVSITCSRDGTKVYTSDMVSSPANSKIYYSGDNGSTFSTIYNPASDSIVLSKIICDTATGSRLIATDTSGNILLSDNAYLNRTFTKQVFQNKVSDITMDYYGATPYYMTFYSGLYTQPPQKPSYLLSIGNSSRPFYSSQNVLCNADGSVVYLVNYGEALIFISANSGRTYIQDTITFNTNPSNQQAFTSVIGNSSLSYLLFTIKDFTTNNFYLSFFQPPSGSSSNTTGSVSASSVYNSISTPAISNISTEYELQTISSSGQYMYVVNNGIGYRSDDYGLNFYRISLDYVSIACSSDGSKVYLSSSDDTMNVSTDFGLTFTVAAKPSNGGNILCDSTGQKLFLSSLSGIFRSTNSGQSWTQVFNTGAALQKLVCDSTGTYLMFYLLGSGLYFSDDTGTTWILDTITSIVPLGSSTPGMTSSASGLKQYILYRSGLYLRSGTSQTNSSPVSKSISALTCSADASTVIALSAYDSTKIYKSTNYGGTLTSLTGITSSVSGIGFLGTNSDCSSILYFTKPGPNAEDGKLYLYNGTSSTAQTILDSNGSPIAPPYRITSIAVSSDGNYKYIIHTNSNNSNLYGSSNGSFTYKSTAALENKCYSVTCSYDGSYVFVCTDSSEGKIYISSDNATSFSSITLPNGVKAKYTACDSSGTMLYVTTTGSTIDDGIYKINRSGSTWGQPSLVYSITDGTTIFTSITSNSTGTYMVATDDIFFSDDGGVTWQMLPNPPTSRIGPVAMNASGSRIYYAFSGSGLFTRNASSISTPCFLEGTKVLCLLSGLETYLAVETLRPGTLVKTPGGFKRVDKIGKSGILNPGHSGRTMDRLYLCRKENFPELTEDLYITGYHSILVDELTENEQKRTLEINGQVFEASGKKCLMAAVCEKTEPWAQEGTFTIWHFSLEDEDEKSKFGVYSNGLLTETCSVEYMDTSSLHTRLESVSQVPKHFFNKSLICKRRA
jgi:hypothetical protein